MLRPRDCNIQSPFISQKADAALEGCREVGADAVENDDVFLSPLESINCVDLDGCLELTVLAAAEWTQLIFEVAYMRLIWRNDTNTAGNRFQSSRIGTIKSNKFN